MLKRSLGPVLLSVPLALMAMACPTRNGSQSGTGGAADGGGGRAGGGGASAGGSSGTGGAAGGMAGAGGTAGAGGNAGTGGSRTDGGATDAGCALVKGVIDFEDLAFSGSSKLLPVPYIRDGFALTNYGADPLSVVGSKALQYLNTTAVLADNTSTTTLARASGQLFSLQKIDLSTFNDEHPGVIYTFTGTLTDGYSVVTTIPLLTSSLGFVTYTLPASFSEVTSVSWTMNTVDVAQYFDNIRYSYCSADGG